MRPKNEQELLARAESIAGLTLSELASQWHIAIPPNLKRDKVGWNVD